MGQQDVSLAAESATTLSELLEQETLFKPDALRWLEGQHIDKFRKAIDETEYAKIAKLAAKWRYPDAAADTDGFPVLDWLWRSGVDAGYQRSSVRVSTNQGFIASLAKFQPDWVGAWWQLRFANKKGTRPNVTSAEEALIGALTREELVKRFSSLDDEVVAAIIASRPEFFELLPANRRGIILHSALLPGAQFSGVLEGLSKHEIPSDATVVMNAIFDGYSILVMQRKRKRLLLGW
jgi:hypothetical protein